MLKCLSIVGGLIWWVTSGAVAQAETLHVVQERGYLLCGVDEQLQGFAALDAQGHWQGIEVDYCRALAAAIFQGNEALEVVPLNAQTRFSALQSNAVDVVMRITGQSYARERFYNLRFPYGMIMDQVGALVRTEFEFSQLEDVTQAQICVNEFSASHDWIREFPWKPTAAIQIRKYNSRHGAQKVFFSDGCDIYVDHQFALEAMRQTLTLDPKMYRLLRMDHPLYQVFGPVVRSDDLQWFGLVKWVMNSLVLAEELKLSRYDVQRKLWDTSLITGYFMGDISGIGEGIGLTDAWARHTIASVGNYGEIFNRHLGSLGMERGVNQLIEKGVGGLCFMLKA